MKRITSSFLLASLWIMIVAIGLLAPVSYQISTAGTQIIRAEALAVLDPGTPTGPSYPATCPDGKVKLGVPLADGQACIDNDPAKGGAIVVYLRMFLRFISGLIGIVLILMLTVAGIQYITSAGDPGLIKKAKERIINALTALLLFVMGFAILSFLLPGGVL